MFFFFFYNGRTPIHDPRVGDHFQELNYEEEPVNSRFSVDRTLTYELRNTNGRIRINNISFI
jgi:hypothetical protein